MLETILIILTIVSLAVLYKFLPNRRIFIYFCISLVIVFVIAALISRMHEPQQTMNENQRYALQQQQKIFTIWYAEYQKDIDQLDRNWQLYHSLLDSFNNENMDIETMYERLSELENDALIEQVHIHALKVPPGLGEECNVQLAEMIRKTQKYSDAQTQTISMTKNAAEPKKIESKDLGHKEQVRLFQDIMIRESPAGLFTSSELSAILDYFVLPDDFPDKAE